MVEELVLVAVEVVVVAAAQVVVDTRPWPVQWRRGERARDRVCAPHLCRTPDNGGVSCLLWLLTLSWLLLLLLFCSRWRSG